MLLIVVEVRQILELYISSWEGRLLWSQWEALAKWHCICAVDKTRVIPRKGVSFFFFN